MSFTFFSTPSQSKSSNFQIENILSPEFGKKISKCSSPSSTTETTPSIPATATTTSTTASNNHNTHHVNNDEKQSVDRDSPESDQPHNKKVRHSYDISDSECSTTSNSSSLNHHTEASNLSLISSPASSLPAWVNCTRNSDRPSPGPRPIKMKKKTDEKRPRTAFTAEQLQRLEQEFQDDKYLNEIRRKDLADELKLNKSQITTWFSNKRAKIKKANVEKNPLAFHLTAEGLYNHSRVAIQDGDDNDDLDYLEDDKLSN